jgi:hypothetical protein
MSSAGDYDVVVIGFGPAGVAAALEARAAGARVLALDRRGFIARAHGAPPVRSMSADVEIRTQTVVHELLVEGGRVTGVGCATMDRWTPSGARYWWLARLSEWAPRLSRTLGRAAARAADSLWQEASEVEEIRAGAVILAMEREHWDFVGPAVWATTAGVGCPERAGEPRRHLRLVTEEAPPSPELKVRSWCSAQTSGTGVGLGELSLDRASGALRSASGVAVPGLYAALPEQLAPTDSALEAGRARAAGRRAGRAAAAEPAAWQDTGETPGLLSIL